MSLKGSEMKVLNVLAAMKSQDVDTMDKATAGSMAKVKGSTLRNAYAKLKKDGLVVYLGSKDVKITSAGMDKSDPSTYDDFKLPTSNEEKWDEVRAGLKSAEKEVFEAMLDGNIYDKVRPHLGRRIHRYFFLGLPFFFSFNLLLV